MDRSATLERWLRSGELRLAAMPAAREAERFCTRCMRPLEQGHGFVCRSSFGCGPAEVLTRAQLRRRGVLL